MVQTLDGVRLEDVAEYKMRIKDLQWKLSDQDILIRKYEDDIKTSDRIARETAGDFHEMITGVETERDALKNLVEMAEKVLNRVKGTLRSTDPRKRVDIVTDVEQLLLVLGADERVKLRTIGNPKTGKTIYGSGTGSMNWMGLKTKGAKR